VILACAPILAGNGYNFGPQTGRLVGTIPLPGGAVPWAILTLVRVTLDLDVRTVNGLRAAATEEGTPLRPLRG
jgi:hypothetical protein